MNKKVYKAYYIDSAGNKRNITTATGSAIWKQKKALDDRIRGSSDCFVETYELQLTNTQTSLEFSQEYAEDN